MRASRRITAGLLCLLVVGAVSCSTSAPTTGSIDSLVGRASQDEVREQLGRPQTVLTADDGGEIWVYQYGGANPRDDDARFHTATSCWLYGLEFNDLGVLEDWVRVDCSEYPDPLALQRLLSSD